MSPTAMIPSILLPVVVLALLCGLASLLIARHIIRKRMPRSPRFIIGLFHPHPLGGGGGERVLWATFVALQARFGNAEVIVYGDFGSSSINEVKYHVQDHFGFNLQKMRFTTVNLKSMSWAVRPSSYPRLTLLLQAIGAFCVGAIAFWRRPANVVVETGNFTFALVMPYLLGAWTVAYVHYPIISSDMVALVRSREANFNNSSRIARSPFLSKLKSAYYHFFALMYAIAARCVHVPVANSSWTRAHLRLVWRRQDIALVFPPCAVRKKRTGIQKRDVTRVISVAQFRPEKNHALQLNVFEEMAKRYPQHKLHLTMVGGTRNSNDKRRARQLAHNAAERGLPVDLCIDAPREKLEMLLDHASIGLHTMRNEHFGISVVELQSAGLIVVAHNSGGVAADIVEDGRTGFLADDAVDFADRIWQASTLSGSSRGMKMRMESQVAALRFSDTSFQKGFIDIIASVCNSG